MQDQQNNLCNQINYLKEQTHKANIERFEALKEVEKLKDEITKQRNEEEMRKNYVRKVLSDNSKYEDDYNYNQNNYYSENHDDFDKRLNEDIDYNLNLGNSQYKNLEINESEIGNEKKFKSKTYNPNEIHSFNYTKNSFSSNKLSEKSKNINFQFFNYDKKKFEKIFKQWE